MATCEEREEAAGQWMWEKLQAIGYLSEWDAVTEIGMQFGEDLVTTTNNGNPAIAPGVLQVWNRLNEGRAEWHKPPDNGWSLREEK